MRRNFLCLTLLFTILLAGCNLSGGPDYGKGTLTLLLPETAVQGTPAQTKAAVSRSVLSDEDTSSLIYKLSFTGPGESQTLEAGGGGITVSLDAGEWTVKAEAYKQGDLSTLVGSGSAVITVIAGRSNSVSIPMRLNRDYERTLTNIYIHTEEDLRRIAAGEFDISGSFITHFYLERDIVLTQPWTPIGSLEPYSSPPTNYNPFKAVFDGQGHSITISAFSAEALAGMSLGLFGGTEGATIKDTTIIYNDLRAISSYSDSSFPQCVGGLAAFAYDTTISGVHVRGTIRFTASNSLSVGGLLGLAGSFLNAYTHVKNCSFTGNLEVSGDPGVIAGGILGAHDDQSEGAIIETSYAAGKINAVSLSKEAYAGGIAGKGGCSIENCYAVVKVEASAPSLDAYAGGIIGQLSDDSESFLNCYALGPVKAEGTAIYAGGIAGDSESDIENCVALANVDGTGGSFVGRVIGNLSSAAATNNYAASDKTITGGGASTAVNGYLTYTAAELQGQANQPKYGGLSWTFDTPESSWNWIDGYDYPVLAWQTSPPADPANPQSLH